MKRSEKTQAVAAIEEIYRSSKSVVMVHYHGLTVDQMTSLRASLGELGAEMKVVKNTLSRIAAKSAGFGEDALALMKGPTAIAYASDEVSAAKGVVEFAKKNENLKVVGGVLASEVLDASAIKHLASMPSLDELRGKLIGVLQAPASKIVGVTQAPAGQLARVTKAYATK